MNDNAPDFICTACGRDLSFGPAFRPDRSVTRAMTEAEKNAALDLMGWRRFGEGWICGEHKMEAV